MKNPKYVLEITHPNSGRILEVQVFTAKERKEALRAFKKEAGDIYHLQLSEYTGQCYEGLAWTDDDEEEGIAYAEGIKEEMEKVQK